MSLRGTGLAVVSLALGFGLALGFMPAAAQAQCFAGTAADVGGAPHVRLHTPDVVARAANVSFCGGPVMHSERVHLIYWAPQGSGLTFDPGYEQTIDTFIHRVVAADHSTTNLFGLIGQYHDGTGPAAYDVSFGGAVIDSDPAPTNVNDTCTEPLAPPLGTGPPGWTLCVDDAGIQSELQRVVRADHLPSGLKDVYFMITPDGFGSCFESGPSDCADGGDANQGYCGYHSATGNPGLIYAVIPYNALVGHCQSTNPRPNASTADPAISTVSHELAESATDPLGDAWLDDSGNEIADLCITNYGPSLGGSGSTRYDEVIDGGHYWIQELWSNYSYGCEPAAKPDTVSFSVASRTRGTRSGVMVGFTVRAHDPQGKIDSYYWKFGDGRSETARHALVQHTFRRAGVYTVTLRTTDSWDNWAFETRKIRVGRG